MAGKFKETANTKYPLSGFFALFKGHEALRESSGIAVLCFIDLGTRRG
jgi:hypothetical protein